MQLDTFDHTRYQLFAESDTTAMVGVATIAPYTELYARRDRRTALAAMRGVA